jgi:hypothetical protein
VAGGAITLLIAAFGLKIFPALNRLESIRRYDKI